MRDRLRNIRLTPEILGSVIVFLAVVFGGSLAGDTLWSIRLGQDLLAGENIFVERWSWTAEGSYYPNHEWLFELIVYLLWLAGAKTFALLHVMNGLIAVAGFWLMRPTQKLIADRGLTKNFLSHIYFLGLPALGLSTLLFWELRAQSFSFLFMALSIWLLKTERYRWIPLVFLVWANIHGGFSIGAYVLFSAFLIALIVDVKRKELSRASRAGKLFLAGVLSFAATFLTPLGYKNWTYFYDKIIDRQQILVSEFQPTLSVSSGRWMMLILGAIFLCSLLAVRKDWLKHWELQLAIFLPLLFIPVSLTAIRFLVFLGFLTLPLLLILPMLPTKEGAKSTFNYTWLKKLSRPILAVVKAQQQLVLSLALVATAVIAGAMLVAQQDKDLMNKPSAAIMAGMDECRGEIYNDYNAGAFLLFWKPDTKVFIDNRYDPYPKPVRDVMLPAADGWKGTMEASNVECAVFLIVETTENPAEELMEEAGWELALRDGVYFIYKNPNYDPSKPTVFSPRG